MTEYVCSPCCINSVRILEEIRDLIKSFVVPRAEKKEKPAKPKKAPIPYWQDMIAHIDETWTAKKKSKYPFNPAEMKMLRTYAKLYMPWGVMALWDCFLASDDPFYRQTGYKIAAFVHGLPKLLDQSWKPTAEHYRKNLEPPDQSISSLIAGLANEKTLKI